ncbi:MAG: hypothetical protein AAF546_09080 [Verrucomicrobiota bacterium]
MTEKGDFDIGRLSLRAWLLIALFMLQCLLLTFILIFVVPVFAEMFSDFEADLPKLTQILFYTSEFLKSYIIIGFPVLAAMAFGVVSLFRYFESRKQKIAMTILSLSMFSVLGITILVMFLPIFGLRSVVG